MGKQSKIAIIGPYPPPIGGISIHISRVLAYLDAGQYKYDFYCENKISKFSSKYQKFYSFNKIIAYIKILLNNYSVIHHHSPSTKDRIVLAILSAIGKNVYLHIHGASLADTIQAKSYKSFLTRKLLKYVNILADNEKIATLARNFQAKSVNLIDAFVPQQYDESILQEYLNKYGECLSKKNFIISMVGWFDYYNGEDLYGFDLAVYALKKLKERDSQVLLIISINGINDDKVYENFISFVKVNNLNENILIVEKNAPEIWPIYCVSDVFIRPTNTDGSSLSIKEALWFETPVITSDCIPRPDEVILFTNRSKEDLFIKLQTIMMGKKDISRQESIKIKIDKVIRKRYHYSLFSEIYKLTSE